jgi:hypothetical protein
LQIADFRLGGIGSFARDGLVIGTDRAGELVGGDPGDETAVVVVHRIVPAVGIGRQLGWMVVVGFAVHDLLAAFPGQLAQGNTCFGLAEKRVNEIADERPAAE